MNQPPSPRGQGPGARLFRGLNLLDRGIAWFEAKVLAWGIILIALNTVANVFGRIFGQSLYFSEELNQFLIVLVTFVGMGYAARQGRHIRMSALYDQFGEQGRKVLMIIVCSVTALLMFALAWYSLNYVLRVADMGRVTPALRVPLYLTYLWVPVGFLITGIQYLLTVLINLREKAVYISYEHIDTYDDADQAGI